MARYVSFLYVAALYGAVAGGWLAARSNGALASRGEGKRGRWIPWATLTTAVAIAISAAVQSFRPAILVLFRRDAGAIFAGEWWRILMTLFVQDGGVTGSVFNVVSLLAVGSIAERLWDWRRWLLLFFAGGVVDEIASLAWQPVGAGNSVANFSLAASIAVVCLSGRSMGWRVRAGGGLTIGAACLLLMLRDIHGLAAVIGAVIALGLMRFARVAPRLP